MTTTTNRTRRIASGAVLAAAAARTMWTPAFYSPSYCGGHWTPESISNQQSYPVAPNTVLPDEPGWLPPSDRRVGVAVRRVSWGVDSCPPFAAGPGRHWPQTGMNTEGQ